MSPIISVVCPTYNSAPFVRETLMSLFAQTQAPSEIIIADDGSTDDTVAVVEAIAEEVNAGNVRILRNPHRGPGAARNAAIKAAAGEWIGFLDSDDLWHPEKIARVSAAIMERAQVNFFCHDQYRRSADGTEQRLNLPGRYQGAVMAQQLFINCPFATSAVVCRKDLLVDHGLFNEMLLSAQDYELWLRLLPDLRVYFIPEALGWYINRPGNISSKRRWRHLRNELSALVKNRRNTTPAWYAVGVAAHLAAFAKHELERIAFDPR